MEELTDVVRRVGAWTLSLSLAALVVYGIAIALLPRIARTTSLFIGTPGGIAVVVLTWRYMGRKKSH